MIKEQLDTMLEALRQQRDEVRLQLHLLGMEAREEWQHAERLWDKLQSVFEDIRKEGASQVDEMLASFKQLAGELEAEYKRIKPRERLIAGLEDLRTMRDELRLQVALMNMEAREEWEAAERAWDRLAARVDDLKNLAEDAFEEAAEALDKIKDDIRERYRRIRKD